MSEETLADLLAHVRSTEKQMKNVDMQQQIFERDFEEWARVKSQDSHTSYKHSTNGNKGFTKEQLKNQKPQKCIICGEVKMPIEFYMMFYNKDGLENRCKKCKRENDRGRSR